MHGQASRLAWRTRSVLAAMALRRTAGVRHPEAADPHVAAAVRVHVDDLLRLTRRHSVRVDATGEPGGDGDDEPAEHRFHAGDSRSSIDTRPQLSPGIPDRGPTTVPS